MPLIKYHRRSLVNRKLQTWFVSFCNYIKIVHLNRDNEETWLIHDKNVSLFARNMYNPRPHKYNELPVNDLSTEEGTDFKPLRFLLSSSCASVRRSSI